MCDLCGDVGIVCGADAMEREEGVAGVSETRPEETGKRWENDEEKDATETLRFAVKRVRKRK